MPQDVPHGSPIEGASPPVDELYAPCLRGDRGAWRALYEREGAAVQRVLRWLGVRREDLLDQTHEVFLVVHRKLAGFRGEAQFSTWLRSICIKVAARYRRRLLIRSLFHRVAAQAADPATEAPTPVEVVLRREARQELERLLTAIGGKKREVFVLYEIEGLAPLEIAQALGCPVETVWSRLRHARREFLEQLAGSAWALDSIANKGPGHA